MLSGDGEIFHFSPLGATCISIPHRLPFPAGCSSFSACGHADSSTSLCISPLEPRDFLFAVPRQQQGHSRSNTSPRVIKSHWAGREQSKYSWWRVEWASGEKTTFQHSWEGSRFNHPSLHSQLQFTHGGSHIGTVCPKNHNSDETEVGSSCPSPTAPRGSPSSCLAAPHLPPTEKSDMA